MKQHLSSRHGTTPKTHLRPLRVTDIPLFVRWLRDPEIHKLTTRNKTIPTERAVIHRVIDMINQSDDLHRIIMVGNVSIGYCALVRRRGNIFETQIAIDKPFWNKGYGTKALQLLFSLAEREKVGTISIEVLLTNKRALHVYKKLGFTEKASAVRSRKKGSGAITVLERSMKKSG